MSDTQVVALDEHRPHLEGKAFCLHCKHEWHAVVPVGVVDGLECPSCACMRGIMRYHCAPPDGTAVFTCECGGQYFMGRAWKDGLTYLMCINCGLHHEPDSYL